MHTLPSLPHHCLFSFFPFFPHFFLFFPPFLYPSDAFTSDSHVLTVANFDDLPSIVDRMRLVTCGAPQVVEPGQAVVTTTVESCDMRFFKPQCSNLANVKIVLTVNSGSADLYVSTRTTQPGPFNYEQRDISASAIKIILVTKSASDSVYVGVRGTSIVPSNFTLATFSNMFPATDNLTATVQLPDTTAVGTEVYTPNEPANLGANAPTFIWTLTWADAAGPFTVNSRFAC